MSTFTVTARRVEVVTLEVEADDVEDARSQVERGGGTATEPAYGFDSISILSVEED